MKKWLNEELSVTDRRWKWINTLILAWIGIFTIQTWLNKGFDYIVDNWDSIVGWILTCYRKTRLFIRRFTRH